MRNTRLTIFLPTLITSLAVLAAILVGVVSYQQFNSTLKVEIQTRLNSIAMARSNAVKSYFQSIIRDLRVTSENQLILKAVGDFEKSFHDLGAQQAKSYLQKHYIQDNPYDIGKKDQLYAAQDQSDYTAAHSEYHPWLHSLMKIQGYYDIFLIDLKGNVIYTVYKEQDFATNLTHGDFKDSGLARVYHRALKINKSSNHGVVFEDYSPYAPSNNQPASFVAKVIHDHNGEKKAVLAYQIPADKIDNIINNHHALGETGDMVMIGADYIQRTNSRFATNNQILDVTWDHNLIDTPNTDNHVTEVNGTEKIYTLSPLKILDFSGNIIGTQDLSEATKESSELSIILSILVITVIIAVTIIGFLAAKTVTRPLIQLTRNMEDLSQDKLDTHILYAGQKNEVGIMARMIVYFKDQLVKIRHLEQEKQEQEQRQKEKQRQNMNNLADSFEESVASVIEFVGVKIQELGSTSTQMNAIATKTLTMAADTTTHSEQSSANVQTIATTTEELSRNDAHINQHITQSSLLSQDVSNEASITRNTVQSMEQEVKKIGQVASLISDIAEQTNLLALNATIEAARAGEAGKGFAVVASEVKHLADQTSKATQEISEQLNQVTLASSKTAHAVNHIDTGINNLRDIIQNVSATVTEQNSAREEITQRVEETAVGVQSVADTIKNVADSAKETDNVSKEVHLISTELITRVNQLQNEVQVFLQDVRHSA